MDDPTNVAAIVALTTAVVAGIDKAIEIRFPNSRINSIWDIVSVFITGALAALMGRQQKK